MAGVNTGEFKIDEYSLIIHPELKLSEFRSGDIYPVATRSETKHSGDYDFAGVIDGLRAKFQIAFVQEHLCKLYIAEEFRIFDEKIIHRELVEATKRGHQSYVDELNKWTEKTAEEDRKKKERHDTWLEKVTGASPPYEYNWGKIISMIEPRDWNVIILVRFKYDFPECVDLKVHFENQREQDRLREMNPPKPFILGKFPPGFSRKK